MNMSTEIIRKNPFLKTGFSNLEQALEEWYGREKANAVFEKACKVLISEMGQINDRGNKAIRKHLVVFILPGFALYKALKETGTEAEDSYNFVRKELHKRSEKSGNFMKKFKKIPFSYEILRMFVLPIIKYGFPKEGWGVEWKEISKKRISFVMTSCLYCDELGKRDALELCKAYCESDHIAYDPLSPEIVFKRTGTLAGGHSVCDFCFEKNPN